MHFASSAPPFLYPCYFGTDIDSRGKSDRLPTIRWRRCADIIGRGFSLGYLSVDGVKKIAEGCKCGFCTGCFTGKYPVEPPESAEKSKFEKKISENIND